MDSAAELSFRMESAKQWQKNVEEEFKRVDELLKLVAEELKTQPYEDEFQVWLLSPDFPLY